MLLTGYPSSEKRRKLRNAQTARPGYVNENEQEVIARTGRASTSFRGQVIYEMKCRRCEGRYGANGCDIHARRCPLCDGGAAGEPVVEKPLGLFDCVP